MKTADGVWKYPDEIQEDALLRVDEALLKLRAKRRACEQAFADPNRVARRADSARGEPRTGIIGATEAGRIVVVIFTRRGERFRVVTAWPARSGDLRAYQGANS